MYKRLPYVIKESSSARGFQLSTSSTSRTKLGHVSFGSRNFHKSQIIGTVQVCAITTNTIRKKDTKIPAETHQLTDFQEVRGRITMPGARADTADGACEFIRNGEPDVQVSFTSIGDEGVRQICEEITLGNGYNLTNLNLYSSGFGDEGAMAIAEMLKTNTLLESIYMDANSITDVGAIAVADALSINPDKSLTTLGIEGNPIGEIGTMAIARALDGEGIRIHTDNVFSKAKIATDVATIIEEKRHNDATDWGAFLLAKEAISSAPNAEAVEKLKASLASIYDEFRHSTASDLLLEGVNKGFDSSKNISSGELARLQGLMDACMRKYQTLKDRWVYLVSIESMKPPNNQPLMQKVPFWYEPLKRAENDVFNPYPEDDEEEAFDPYPEDNASSVFNPFPGRNADDAYLRYLFIQAKWADVKFNAILQTLVKRFNSATYPSDLGMNEEEWPLSMVTEHNGNDDGKNAVYKHGPIKSRVRAVAKVCNDYSDRPPPTYASLADLVRSTVVFDDPYALACFLAYLKHIGLEIVRVKNRFAGMPINPDESESSEATAKRPQYRNVHINICIDGHIGEIQLALKDLIAINHQAHIYYEIQRAKLFSEVSQPMFKQPLVIDGDVLLKEEIERVRSNA